MSSAARFESRLIEHNVRKMLKEIEALCVWESMVKELRVAVLEVL